MATWTCPDCKRTFGAVGRSHMCSPGLTVKRFLADAPNFVDPIFRAVHDHLQSVDDQDGGELIVDPVPGKVLFKNGPTFCIVDVKKKWVAIGFSLRRSLETDRLSRRTVGYGDRYYHVINVDDPELLDDEFRVWLTEAYRHGARGRGAVTKASNFDPMVPDDIDFEIAPPS